MSTSCSGTSTTTATHPTTHERGWENHAIAKFQYPCSCPDAVGDPCGCFAPRWDTRAFARDSCMGAVPVSGFERKWDPRSSRSTSRVHDSNRCLAEHREQSKRNASHVSPERRDVAQPLRIRPSGSRRDGYVGADDESDSGAQPAGRRLRVARTALDRARAAPGTRRDRGGGVRRAARAGHPGSDPRRPAQPHHPLRRAEQRSPTTRRATASATTSRPSASPSGSRRSGSGTREPRRASACSPARR